MDKAQRCDQEARAPPPAEGKAPASPGAWLPPEAEGNALKRPGEPAGPFNPPADDPEEVDPEMDAWLMKTLQRVQPGTEISQEGVQVLRSLLDEVTRRVLSEAQRISAGDPAADPAAAPAAEAPAGDAREPEPGAAAAPPAAEKGSGCRAGSRDAPLTSIDISKALKRVLPGESGEGSLRPFLPYQAKQAWHLDKQSLKGIKKQKQGGGGAAQAEAGPAGPAKSPGAAEAAPDGSENVPDEAAL